MNHFRRRLGPKSFYGEQGFTLVELITVMAISLIILAGIVVLLSGTFDIFKSNRNLLAITDSSRRAVATMTRQLRGALHFVSGTDNCDETHLTFYADVTAEPQYSFANVQQPGNYLNAPKIKWEYDQAKGEITQQTVEPRTEPGYEPTPVKLASGVTDLKFEYYGAGSSEPLNLPSYYGINREAVKIRISISVQKGNARRTFHQDVFLRVQDREQEGEVSMIFSVTPGSSFYPNGILVNVKGVGTHWKTKGVDLVPPVIPRVTVSGSGVTAGTPTVISDTELTVTLTVGDTPEAVGPHDVNVITGSEYPIPKYGGFTVI